MKVKAGVNYREMLESLIEEHEGLILTTDVTKAGIPRTYLGTFVREDILERVTHGVYLSKHAFEAELSVCKPKVAD
ncbi:type IV toxin-antitoxin system AbiEi family antitoxin domain-containing protein [Sporosarcina sp. GW1-11]|uniref:type IV toxin-antitoxin system AbiEi family antitoxin domain-containing protein n=1 Tax=Sporosarcina sp. GW1-11 TaxID=2899126 RepID=UPI00294FC345|nr:type IV toxin-antitoxin system AbiEi family antitoxin domain-containing protein [Sporosarcina sp. GW1-11]MDV6377749.1 type IV toxin-antitoxin system AbiEi family antitoxin domain-containing protein [Sporosarcina sp. GW1-11]